MKNFQEIKPPSDLNWQSWVERWDRMQEGYLVKRTERFETIVRLIRETQNFVSTPLDLGCGPVILIFQLVIQRRRVTISV